MLEEASEIINEKIGSFNSDITDSRFLSRIQKLCLRMVDRMSGIDNEQSKGNFFGYSQTDYLNTRERDYLSNVVGKALNYKKPGRIVF